MKSSLLIRKQLRGTDELSTPKEAIYPFLNVISK